MRKVIALPIEPEGVNTTDLDKHIAEGWKIAGVAPDTMNGILQVRLEKDEA